MKTLTLSLNGNAVHSFEITEDTTESMARRAARAACAMAMHGEIESFTGNFEVSGAEETEAGWTVTLAPEGTLRAFIAANRERPFIVDANECGECEKCRGGYRCELICAV